MDEIVFLTPNIKEPFTTSDVIAECTGIESRKIKVTIRKYENEFKQFGKIEIVSAPYQAESPKIGRPSEAYKLNEQQATFLMTLLKNTPVVVQFKQRLVQEFFRMRQELQNVRIAKAELKPIRLTMTDCIKALPDSPHKQFKYSQFTNLAYIVAFGKTAKAIREQRGAKKNAPAIDYMTAEEIEQAAVITNKIAVLSGLGFEYSEIKAALLGKKTMIA